MENHHLHEIGDHMPLRAFQIPPRAIRDLDAGEIPRPNGSPAICSAMLVIGTSKPGVNLNSSRFQQGMMPRSAMYRFW
jgi:hypothetical protein